jgi:CubicO group peptidase (beta-lactamase class C family)
MSADRAGEILERARDAGVFPSATAEVGDSSGPVWRAAIGAAPDTLFDLASLTKVIATTTAVMDRVRTGGLGLDARVAEWFGEWRGADREAVTIRDLLEHASGLSARLVDPPPEGQREFEHDICTMPLEYPPRSKSIYSDLGFILLGFLVRLKPDTTTDNDGDESSVWLQPDLLFNPPPALRARIAPTTPMDDDVRRGRVLVGEVHDNYAAALGGVAGHAGLFGTAAAVGAFARTVLRAACGDAAQPMPFTPALVALFTTRTKIPGSSRALGWDTMLPTSSCGPRMSPAAFGHVGFTGTSLWIDPAHDRYFVLLTNRVHGAGTLDQIRDVRRAFHDALGAL